MPLEYDGWARATYSLRPKPWYIRLKLWFRRKFQWLLRRFKK